MKADPQIIVLADAKEANSIVAGRLRDLGVQIKCVELEIGDYVLSGRVAVKRKTANDFVQSVLDGQLFNQTGKLRLNFERAVVLIEGDVYSTRLPIPREAIDGALSVLVTVEGVSVLYVRNPSACADLIFRMAKHAQQGLDHEVAFRRGKVAPGKEEALFCIEGVVGVGPATARRLLVRFRSIHAFMNASKQELMAVSGIGATKAERIYQSIHWQMSEVDEESARPMCSDV